MHSPTRQGPLTLVSPGSLHFSQAYSKEPESVPLARERLRIAAHDSKLDDDLLERAELCLTELATNAVRHAHDCRRIRQFLVQVSIRNICRLPHLEVSVWDVDWRRTPNLPDPGTAGVELLTMAEEVTGGRGLLLVASLAEEIGYDFVPRHGKRIWCRWAL